MESNKPNAPAEGPLPKRLSRVQTKPQPGSGTLQPIVRQSSPLYAALRDKSSYLILCFGNGTHPLFRLGCVLCLLIRLRLGQISFALSALLLRCYSRQQFSFSGNLRGFLI